jgi:asparagine synthase (glutamine-hydrolysing)
MCDIAGLVDLRGLDPALGTRGGEAALARLRPRGPDGEGSWSDARCALVHTRLAVIDLSPGGAQPMARHGRVIAFRGAGLLPRLVGMFAFALWDPEAGELVLARDRFGEKPLLYAAAPRGLAFGSDLLAVEAMLGETRPIDPAGLRWMMAPRFLPDTATIARGVSKLGAGQLLRFSAAGIAVERWYDLAAARQARWTDEAAAAASPVEAFDGAIADWLVADVPVGCFLSGGLDSSLVAASIARTGARLATFTVGFEGTRAYYEERPLAPERIHRPCRPSSSPRPRAATSRWRCRATAPSRPSPATGDTGASSTPPGGRSCRRGCATG